jgi:glycine/D-amino acid oxidase-like deaminating enzyme
MKSDELPSSMFMQTEIVEELDHVNAKFGFGRVKQSGNINMSALLSEFRLKLKSEACLLEEVFDFEELTAYAYREFEFKNIVFCQGHENLENPFFKDLPFKQTKGEVIIIRSEKWKKKGIVHNSINIVPMGNDLYWVGSTFDWDDLSINISRTGKDKLINQLRQIMQCEFEVIEQKAGIRPTVIDRRPILGGHSDHKNYYVFNGLGTRGVMIAPYYANELVLHIEEGKKLEEEVSISRFIE